MKVIKKALSVLLLLSVVLSLSACSATRLKQDSVVKALENQDFEECDDYNEFSEIYGRMNKENAAYVKLTDKKAQKAYDKLFKAQKAYDKLFNRLNKYPSADVTDATCAFFSGKNRFGYMFFFKFEDENKAEKVYKKFVKSLNDADDGEEKSLIYTVSDSKKGTKHIVTNAYLEKTQLMIVYGSVKDTDILEDFTDELKLPSDF